MASRVLGDDFVGGEDDRKPLGQVCVQTPPPRKKKNGAAGVYTQGNRGLG